MSHPSADIKLVATSWPVSGGDEFHKKQANTRQNEFYMKLWSTVDFSCVSFPMQSQHNST